MQRVDSGENEEHSEPERGQGETEQGASLWCAPLSSKKPHFTPVMSAPPSITPCLLLSSSPPLLLVSGPTLINETQPQFNLLTMCNTAPSANSLHCPDLLYTPQGSGGLLGRSLTLPCCLWLRLSLSISASRSPFFSPPSSLCHLSLSFEPILGPIRLDTSGD